MEVNHICKTRNIYGYGELLKVSYYYSLIYLSMFYILIEK